MPPALMHHAGLLGAYRLLREKVWARMTEKTVEIVDDGQRVAATSRPFVESGMLYLRRFWRK